MEALIEEPEATTETWVGRLERTVLIPGRSASRGLKPGGLRPMTERMPCKSLLQ